MRKKQHAARALAAVLTASCLAAPTAARAENSNSGSGTRQAIYLGAAVGLGLLALNDIDRSNELGALAFGAGTLAALWAFQQERRNNRGDEVEAATEAYIRRREAASGRIATAAGGGAATLSLLEPAPREWFRAPTVAAGGPSRLSLVSRSTDLQTFRMTYARGIE